MSLKATSVRLDDETLTRVGQMAEAKRWIDPAHG